MSVNVEQERQKLIDFFNKVDPQQLKAVDNILNRFAPQGPAAMKKLWATLRERYKAKLEELGGDGGSPSPTRKQSAAKITKAKSSANLAEASSKPAAAAAASPKAGKPARETSASPPSRAKSAAALKEPPAGAKPTPKLTTAKSTVAAPAAAAASPAASTGAPGGGGNFPPALRASMTSRLTAFLKRYAPERVPQVDMIMSRVAGTRNPPEAFETLMKGFVGKFGPEPAAEEREDHDDDEEDVGGGRARAPTARGSGGLATSSYDNNEPSSGAAAPMPSSTGSNSTTMPKRNPEGMPDVLKNIGTTSSGPLQKFDADASPATKQARGGGVGAEGMMNNLPPSGSASAEPTAPGVAAGDSMPRAITGETPSRPRSPNPRQPTADSLSLSRGNSFSQQQQQPILSTTTPSTKPSIPAPQLPSGKQSKWYLEDENEEADHHSKKKTKNPAAAAAAGPQKQSLPLTVFPQGFPETTPHKEVPPRVQPTVYGNVNAQFAGQTLFGVLRLQGVDFNAFRGASTASQTLFCRAVEHDISFNLDCDPSAVVVRQVIPDMALDFLLRETEDEGLSQTSGVTPATPQGTPMLGPVGARGGHTMVTPKRRTLRQLADSLIQRVLNGTFLPRMIRDSYRRDLGATSVIASQVYPQSCAIFSSEAQQQFFFRPSPAEDGAAEVNSSVVDQPQADPFFDPARDQRMYANPNKPQRTDTFGASPVLPANPLHSALPSTQGNQNGNASSPPYYFNSSTSNGNDPPLSPPHDSQQQQQPPAASSFYNSASNAQRYVDPSTRPLPRDFAISADAVERLSGDVWRWSAGGGGSPPAGSEGPPRRSGASTAHRQQQQQQQQQYNGVSPLLRQQRAMLEEPLEGTASSTLPPRQTPREQQQQQQSPPAPFTNRIWTDDPDSPHYSARDETSRFNFDDRKVQVVNYSTWNRALDPFSSPSLSYSPTGGHATGSQWVSPPLSVYEPNPRDLPSRMTPTFLSMMTPHPQSSSGGGKHGGGSGSPRREGGGGGGRQGSRSPIRTGGTMPPFRPAGKAAASSPTRRYDVSQGGTERPASYYQTLAHQVEPEGPQLRRAAALRFDAERGGGYPSAASPSNNKKFGTYSFQHDSHALRSVSPTFDDGSYAAARRVTSPSSSHKKVFGSMVSRPPPSAALQQNFSSSTPSRLAGNFYDGSSPSSQQDPWTMGSSSSNQNNRALRQAKSSSSSDPIAKEYLSIVRALNGAE